MIQQKNDKTLYTSSYHIFANGWFEKSYFLDTIFGVVKFAIEIYSHERLSLFMIFFTPKLHKNVKV